MLDSILTVTSLPVGFEIVDFLKGARSYLSIIGGGIISLLGVVLIIYAVIAGFKAVTSQQGGAGGQWFKALLALVFGGAALYGGWNLFGGSLAKGMDSTVKGLGNGGGEGGTTSGSDPKNAGKVDY